MTVKQLKRIMWFDHKINPINVELLSDIDKDDRHIAISELHFMLLAPYDILYSKSVKGKREKLLVLPNAKPYNSVVNNGSQGIILMVGRGFAQSDKLAYKAGDKFVMGGKAFPEQ